MIDSDTMFKEADCSLLTFFDERDTALNSIKENMKRTHRLYLTAISVCAAVGVYLGIIVLFI